MIARHCSQGVTRNWRRLSNRSTSQERKNDSIARVSKRLDSTRDRLLTRAVLYQLKNRLLTRAVLHQLRKGESYETNYADPGLHHVRGLHLGRAGEAEN